MKTPIGALSLLSPNRPQLGGRAGSRTAFRRTDGNQASRLSALVGDLIDLSRLRGRPLKDAEPVSVDAVIAGRSTPPASMAQTRRSRKGRRRGHQGLEVLGVEGHLVTALRNLHQRDPVTARVAPRRRGEQGGQQRRGDPSVTDRAWGSRRRAAPRVQRFYQRGPGPLARDRGTGLGLSIVKRRGEPRWRGRGVERAREAAPSRCLLLTPR